MLTDKQEIALGILLWKFYRSRCDSNSLKMTTQNNLPVANKALELAKSAGVKDEYLQLLFELPVMTLRARELEEWTDSKMREELSWTNEPNSTPFKKESPKKRRNYVRRKS